MKEIPIIEIFGGSGKNGNGDNFCIQGEGKFAGVPSIFVRVFGCNLKCAFGDPSREEVNEVLAKSKIYDSLDELPILKTGCDTFYSIYPQFRRFSEMFDVEKLLNNLEERVSKNVHLVITGGEPLLPGYQEFWAKLIPRLPQIGIKKITFETNGTQKLTTEFKKMLRYYQYNTLEVFFSISPKLSNSGHTSAETLKPEVIQEYVLLAENSWLKYVVSPLTDIKEIQFFNKAYNVNIPVYLMPQGGTKKEYLTNEPIVYTICCELGYHYSPRLQVSALDNKIGA